MMSFQSSVKRPIDKIKLIDNFIRFFLCVLIFWLPYAPAVVETCVVIASLLWLVKRFLIAWPHIKQSYSREKIIGIISSFNPANSLIDIPIIIFLCVCVISIFFSRFPGVSVHGFITKIFEWFIILYLILEVFNRRKYIYIALIVFLFTALSTVTDSFIQFFITHQDIFRHRELIAGRATAGFQHPNTLAAYLVIFICIIIASLFWKPTRNTLFYKTLFLAVFILTLGSFVLTFSRAAWIALVIAVLILLIRLRKQFWIIFLLSFIIFTTTFVYKSTDNFRQKVRLDIINLENTSSWRLGLWKDSIKMIKERPLFGHGINTFMKLFQDYRRKHEGIHPYSPSYAHNCYLQMAAEIGLLGLISFIYIFIEFFKLLASIYNKKQNDILWFILNGLFVGILAFLIHSFFDTDFYSLQLSAYLWISIGLAIAIYKILNTQAV